MSDAECEWYDHRGDIVRAPADARTCFDVTGRWRTHRLFAANQAVTMQSLTYCGGRAGAIPGGDEVDCPHCLTD